MHEQMQFVQDPAIANMSGRSGPGEVGVAPEELPRPPFGSDYRLKLKLQTLFLYCYTKEVVRACVIIYSTTHVHNMTTCTAQFINCYVIVRI